MSHSARRWLAPLIFLLLAFSVQINADNSWAVIASSSRFWLNYRHTANALGIYKSIKRLGIPDSRIILMLADCTACDPRNSFPGQVLPSRNAPNLHTSSAEIDYKDRDVSVESVLQVLTGHHPPGTAASRRLNSNANSTVLVYLTGHGGDGFLKFHDQTELLATDLAAAIKSMHSEGRYKELLLVLDTCQAATLYSELDSVPNWAGIASSKLGQSSYALRSDPSVGAHLVDEFSHYLANYLDRIPLHLVHHQNTNRGKTTPEHGRGGGGARGQRQGPSFQEMINSLKVNRMTSEIAVESSKLGRPLNAVNVLDFFGDSDAGEGAQFGWVPAAPAANIKVDVTKKSSSTHDEQVERSQHENRGDTNDFTLYDMLLQAWP